MGELRRVLCGTPVHPPLSVGRLRRVFCGAPKYRPFLKGEGVTNLHTGSHKPSYFTRPEGVKRDLADAPYQAQAPTFHLTSQTGTSVGE